MSALAVVEPEETAEPGYEFDGAFQAKIAALQLRDTVFASKTDGLIRPEYFESEADAALVKIGLDFYQSYRKAPADATTLIAAIKNAIVGRKLRKDMIDPVRERVRELLAADISDRDFVVDQVQDFAQHRAMEEAIMASVEALDRKDFAAIKKLVTSALDVGANLGGEPYDYWAEIGNRTAKRVALASGAIKPDGISTGSPELDSYLLHAGWGRKELSCIMGPPKAGKSMSLGEFGKNASMMGYNVYYASCEVSKDIIADRTDANVSDTAMRLLKDTPFAVEKKIRDAAAKAGQFIIEDFPSGTLKCSQLRRRLQFFRNRGIIFDLIVLDYPDLMAAEKSTGDYREDQRGVWVDARAIMHEENAAGLVATQVNRSGAGKMTVGSTDVAEDFNKIRTCDLILSINALEEEVKSGEARIYFADQRNGPSKFTLRIKQDREKLQFLKKVLGVE